MKKKLGWIVVFLLVSVYFVYRTPQQRKQDYDKLREEVAFRMTALRQMFNFTDNNSALKQSSQSSISSSNNNKNNRNTPKWKQAQVKYYVDMNKYPAYAQNWIKAADEWNKTGYFTFIRVKDEKQAQVILEVSDTQDTSGKAGLTNNEWVTNSWSHENVLVRSKAWLYIYYLRYYSVEQQINTAEHELGHVIGLQHDDSQISVMQSKGSYYNIQPVDIQKVKDLYSQN